MAAAKVNHEKREITITVPRPSPPADMRAALHRLLDSAIDALDVTPSTDFLTVGETHG